jgi:hypothetical protein
MPMGRKYDTKSKKIIMKTLSIGDIHGRNTWKSILFGSVYNYDKWMLEKTNGTLEENNYTFFNSFDKIIFVGDYVDSYDLGDIEIKKNLLDIIAFKKMLPDKVVLLIGNHDVQYFEKAHFCSGFRHTMLWDLSTIFNNNIEHFQMAYLAYGEDKTKILWTHAGVTNGWFKTVKESLVGHRFELFFKDIENMPVDDVLNTMWQLRMAELFHSDSDSGGYEEFASPLWVRPRRLVSDAQEGYNQIVGHTFQETIRTEKTKSGDEITFIDCLEKKLALVKFV